MRMLSCDTMLHTIWAVPICGWHASPCHARDAPHYNPMPHHPHSLASFYSETIIDAAAFIKAMPAGIEAIFYIEGECDGGCCDVRIQPWMGYGWNVAARCEVYARRVHHQLLREWPTQAASIPLLKLDVYDWETPFSPATQQ